MKTGKKLFTRLLQVKLALIFTIISIVAAGQTESKSEFDKWDKNNDESISRTEFKNRFEKDHVHKWKNNGYKKMHKHMDKEKRIETGYTSYIDTASKDTSVVDDEGFYSSTYNMWDVDRDQRLNEDEWRAGYETSYGNYLDDTYERFDTDADNYISYDEYRSSLKNTDYYSDWDMNRDERLSNSEVSQNVFDSWDQDNNNYIDKNEYNRFQNTYDN